MTLATRRYTEAELREAVEWGTERTRAWPERNRLAIQRLAGGVTELVELRAEVDRLRAALVEERAAYHAAWVTRFPVEDRHRDDARAELRAEGLLP